MDFTAPEKLEHEFEKTVSKDLFPDRVPKNADFEKCFSQALKADVNLI
jgi:hypothetical protein